MACSVFMSKPSTDFTEWSMSKFGPFYGIFSLPIWFNSIALPWNSGLLLRMNMHIPTTQAPIKQMPPPIIPIIAPELSAPDLLTSLIWLCCCLR